MNTRKASARRSCAKSSAVAILLALLVAPAASNDDFRGLRWGDKETDAARQMGAPERREGSVLEYSETLVGRPFFMRFKFDDGGRLVGAGYVLKNAHLLSGAETAQAFRLLQTILTEKYGPLSSQSGADPSKPFPVGNALSLAGWKTDRTNITLLYSSNRDSEPLLIVNYTTNLKFPSPHDLDEEATKL